MPFCAAITLGPEGGAMALPLVASAYSSRRSVECEPYIFFVMAKNDVVLRRRFSQSQQSSQRSCNVRSSKNNVNARRAQRSQHFTVPEGTALPVWRGVSIMNASVLLASDMLPRVILKSRPAKIAGVTPGEPADPSGNVCLAKQIPGLLVLYQFKTGFT
jgi:hypothetical protein